MPLRRSQMRQVSRKGGSRRRAYNSLRDAVYERSGGLCEILASADCTGQCEQVHHKQGRMGDNLLDIEKMAGICHQCHDFIGRNPALAYEKGWMLRRNT